MIAIIPASGKGTRMSSLTQSKSKELMEISGKPLIHYAIEECINAKLQKVIIVITEEKKEIKDYVLKFQNNEFKKICIEFVVQRKADGSGGAVVAAKKNIGNEDFIVLFPDVLISSYRSNIEKMISLFKLYKCPIMLVDKIGYDEVERYGLTINDSKIIDHYFVDKIIEKPTFINKDIKFHGIVGRYVLNNSFIEILEKIERNKKNEIDLTKGLMYKDQKISSVMSGQHYECGSVDSYLRSINLLSCMDMEYINEDCSSFSS